MFVVEGTMTRTRTPTSSHVGTVLDLSSLRDHDGSTAEKQKQLQLRDSSKMTMPQILQATRRAKLLQNDREVEKSP